ncbi:MAG: PEP-CTERM sorting domain-containing protein [Phycisphaerales bacterium]
MKSLITALVAVAATGTAFAGGTTVLAEFEILDHPNGGVAPPTYALSLGNVFGTMDATFSTQTYNNSTLTVSQDNGTGNIIIDMSGTLFGGNLVNNVWVDPFDLAFNFTYEFGVTTTASGWAVDTLNIANSGVLTRLDTNESVTWYTQPDAAGLNGPPGNVFTFAADGWRIDNDEDTWVGRGWLTTNTDGTPAFAHAQDWFFTANVIPTPSSFALLGLGGLVAARRRR